MLYKRLTPQSIILFCHYFSWYRHVTKEKLIKHKQIILILCCFIPSVPLFIHVLAYPIITLLLPTTTPVISIMIAFIYCLLGIIWLSAQKNALHQAHINQYSSTHPIQPISHVLSRLLLLLVANNILWLPILIALISFPKKIVAIDVIAKCFLFILILMSVEYYYVYQYLNKKSNHVKHHRFRYYPIFTLYLILIKRIHTPLFIFYLLLTILYQLILLMLFFKQFAMSIHILISLCFGITPIMLSAIYPKLLASRIHRQRYLNTLPIKASAWWMAESSLLYLLCVISILFFLIPVFITTTHAISNMILLQLILCYIYLNILIYLHRRYKRFNIFFILIVSILWNYFLIEIL